jgi:hypothetical protein
MYFSVTAGDIEDGLSRPLEGNETVRVPLRSMGALSLGIAYADPVIEK